MRFVILHYHILKNAGSTVEELLDRSFGDRFARLDSAERNHIVSTEALLDFVRANPSLTAISSHQIRHPLPEVPGILFFDICFLRDPIERIRSMHDYFRKRPSPGDPVSDLANTLAQGAFVAKLIEDHPLQVRNVQVNLLATGGDSDEPTEQDLDVAVERMLAASFPGVVDMFPESVEAGEYFLRQVFPELDCAVSPANVSARLEEGDSASERASLRDLCEPAVFDELLRLNSLDFRLLDRVRADITQRCQSIPCAEYPLAPAPKRTLSGNAAAVCRQLFDADFYLSSNPDVAAAGVDPLKHYIRFGSAEGRKPHPLFQPEFYLAQCPDAGRGNGNPLLHYLQTGAGNPHRLFDQAAYRREHPEVAAKNLNPLLHFLLENTHRRTGGVLVDDVGVYPALYSPHQRRFLRAVNYKQWCAQGADCGSGSS